MRAPLLLLWIAGFVQLAIASANLFLPAKLNYRENLSRVSPIIRQIFVVHSVYIVGVVLLFAAVTFGFTGELASGHGLGRFWRQPLRCSGWFALPSSSSITTPCCVRTIAGAILRSLPEHFSSVQLTAQPSSRTDCKSPPRR